MCRRFVRDSGSLLTSAESNPGDSDARHHLRLAGMTDPSHCLDNKSSSLAATLLLRLRQVPLGCCSIPIHLMASATAATIQVEKILTLLEEYPLQLSHYDYGTAGFRYDATVMAPVMVRVGLVSRLLLLQSAQLQQENHTATGSTSYGTNMGVMLTASHNDESYNGIKIASAPDGSMLDETQEQLLIQWVNESNLDRWKEQLLLLMSDESSPPPLGMWHVGRDTRSHSHGFSQLVLQAAQYMGVQVMDHGILTTPMLHHIVLVSNSSPPSPTSTATRQAYLEQLAEAYCALDQLLLAHQPPPPSTTTVTDYDNDPTWVLQVDGACGVGYSAVTDLIKTLQRLDDPKTTNHTDPSILARRFRARNPPGSGPLNDQCGSEHVQKQLMPPIWYDEKEEDDEAKETKSSPYACSVDGDADRIVFWSTRASTTTTTSTTTTSTTATLSSSSWTLLDGDKIAVLIAQFFQQLQLKGDVLPKDLSIGVVQTAYANGASTLYLKNTLHLPVVITKTGVKHLHHAAQQFDIGIYFEANGHGTVVFSEKYTRAASSSPLLYQLSRLINPAVGDALSDLLLVDLLLRRHFHWTLAQWATHLYTDLPSRQLKVQVKDRSMIVCNDNETQVVEPVGLQPRLMSLYRTNGKEEQEAKVRIEQGRCFVRPSGTENVVRIYAEAKTRDMADALALSAVRIVHEDCQGTGPLPSKI